MDVWVGVGIRKGNGEEEVKLGVSDRGLWGEDGSVGRDRYIRVISEGEYERVEMGVWVLARESN